MSLSNIATAFRQYADRPADERFPSIDALIAHALAEKNLSVERSYNLKDLHVVPVSEDGSIASGPLNDLALASPKGQAQFTHWSFSQLARTLHAPAGYLRDDLSPSLAADCLNYGLAHSPAGTSANLLVRGANGAPPSVRAITTESYGRLWDCELYSAINEMIVRRDSSQSWILPPTWSGEPAGAYRGDRDSFLIVVNGGSIVTDPSLTNAPQRPYTSSSSDISAKGAGQDSLYRGLLIRNSEVGAAGIVIECILYRYICGNHMLWGAMVDRSFRRRHVGKNVLRDTVREIGVIARKWTDHSPAQDEAMIRLLISSEIAHSRDAVIDELQAMGATKAQATSAYDLCEQTEAVSPRSFWGAVQGLTRLSQQSAYQDDRYTLDKLAASILAKGARVAA